MIIVIDALNAEKFSDILDETYKLRARVFEGRLGWDVNVVDGREIDQFDALDPAHVVCLDDDGDVVGCMRLLQSTGPHMLADVFYDLLDGEPPLRSSQIWEATRFCVDANKLTKGKSKNSISYVTSEVMLGAFEYAQEAGVLDAVAVIDPVMNRVLQRSGNAPYDYLGSTKPMGVVRAMAALMDCSDERIASIRAFSDIDYDVFLSEDEALALFEGGIAAKRAPEPVDLRPASPEAAAQTEDLQRYCYEQVLNASEPRDVQAALDLLKILSSKIGTDTPSELQRIAQKLPSRSVPQSSHA